MALIGIAHLTLLRLSPPELVAVAAEAGFNFVGVRVKAVTDGESQYPMAPGSTMSHETLRRLADTGLEVLDVEFLTLNPQVGQADWLPALEAGAALGARTISAVGADSDRSRLSDNLSALTEDALKLGIRPTLEPISYQPISTVSEAADLAAATGAAVLLDALHIQRGGSTIADVAALDSDLVPVLQLCDGPIAAPTGFDPVPKMPFGMTANGSPLQIEARAMRQLVGAGGFPLEELVAAAPTGTPISIEVPNGRLESELGAAEFASLQLRSVRALLERVASRA